MQNILNQEIPEKLRDIVQTVNVDPDLSQSDLRNIKTYFSIDKFCKTFKFCDKKSLLDAINNLMFVVNFENDQTDFNFSEQVVWVYDNKVSKKGKASDCLAPLNIIGYSINMIQEDKILDEQKLIEVKKYIDYLDLPNYAKRRIDFRSIYSNNFNRFSGIINDMYVGDENIKNAAVAVLEGYYGKMSCTEINSEKNVPDKQKYQDYISAQELRDLSLAFVKTYYAIKENNLAMSEVISVAFDEAEKLKNEFFVKFNCLPIDYPIHENKPLVAKKNIFKKGIFNSYRIPIDLPENDLNKIAKDKGFYSVNFDTPLRGRYGLRSNIDSEAIEFSN